MAKIANAHGLVQRVENIVGDRLTAGHKVTQKLDPLAAIEYFQRLFGGVVDEKECRHSVQLCWDLSVGSGKHLPDAGFHGARQTPAAGDKQINPPAALTDPISIIAGAGPTLSTTGVVGTD